MSPKDISWARESLPPLMTTMVDAQFVDPPSGTADAALVPWTFTSPYPFDAGAPDSAALPARPHRFPLVTFLRGLLSSRPVDPQHGI